MGVIKRLKIFDAMCGSTGATDFSDVSPLGPTIVFSNPAILVS